MRLGQILTILWPLVKRDYALQYAGSFLGILWVLLQNTTLILVYAFVFLFLNWKNTSSQEEYTCYVFSGLLFWLPLQEFWIRGTTILTDNRQLIKRSNLGMGIFLWIPYVQYLIHILVTSIPVLPMLYLYDQLNWTGIFFGYVWMALTGLYLWLFLNYLSRLNIILKDITPLVRLVTQILFWSLPILYYPQGIFQKVQILNPFLVPLDIFRMCILLDYKRGVEWYFLFPFLLLAAVVYWGTRSRFHRVVVDHL